MAKGDFIIIRAKPGDRQTLEECAKLSRATFTEVMRTALERYLADLRKRGKRS